MKRVLTLSYLGLIILFLAFVACSIRTPNEWWSGFFSNLGSEIFGILLTIFVVDRVIEANRAREIKQYRTVALQQLRLPLIHHLTVLINMIKASTTTVPANPSREVRDLFDDQYFDEIKFLDFSKESPVYGQSDWFVYLSQEFTRFKDALERTVEKYSLYLDPQSLNLIEQIINSHAMAFIIQSPGIRNVDQKEGYRRHYNLFEGDGFTDLIREYGDLFATLVEAYNKHAPSDGHLAVNEHDWSNNISPKIGSARFEIAE